MTKPHFKYIRLQNQTKVLPRALLKTCFVKPNRFHWKKIKINRFAWTNNFKENVLVNQNHAWVIKFFLLPLRCFSNLSVLIILKYTYQQVFTSSKLTIETIEKGEKCVQSCSGVFSVNFKHISHLFLVFLRLTLKK